MSDFDEVYKALFGGKHPEKPGQNLETANLIENIRKVVNQHSRSLKQIVNKLSDLEKQLKDVRSRNE